MRASRCPCCFQTIQNSLESCQQQLNRGPVVKGALARLSEESLKKIHDSLQSNNQDHKVLPFAKELFKSELTSLAEAALEIKNAEDAIYTLATVAFDTEYFTEQGMYNMQLFVDDVLAAMKNIMRSGATGGGAVGNAVGAGAADVNMHS